MKRRDIGAAIATLCALCSVVPSAKAEVVFNGERNTIGVRATNGAEVAYQRYLSDKNRIEATLGLGGYGFDAAATYQRLFDLAELEKGSFNWYVGGGGVLGAWTRTSISSGFALGVAAQAGVEWGFKRLPLVLSADYRPTYYFLPTTKWYLADAFGISARYAF